MCALIGAQTKSDFERILKINRYRGEVNHSIALLKMDADLCEMAELVSVEGPYSSSNDDINFDRVDYNFIIGHTQAPTGSLSAIHPAYYQGAYLWHNGIVKQKDVKDEWDTHSILKGIVSKGFSHLSTVDGSFACFLLMDKKFYVFRNEICPLFWDPVKLTFSSTKLKDCCSIIAPNKVFAVEKYNLNMSFRYVASFVTKENPYYF